MITELGKLYRPVTTLPEEDGRYLTITSTDNGDVASIQNFRNGCWALPNNIQAWMPIPPVLDNFNEVCFLNVGNKLELERGEIGSLIVHPPEDVDGATVEVLVTVVEDLEDDDGSSIPPAVVVILKSYLGDSSISIDQACATFADAREILRAESQAKDKFGAAHPELVMKVLEEQAKLAGSSPTALYNFEVPDAD